MLTIITNHQPRLTMYGYELTDAERKEFDYLDFTENGDGWSATFVRYKNWVYDVCEFMRISDDAPFNAGVYKSDRWDGYESDSFFSGVLCRFPENDDDYVIMGTYYS